MVIQEGSATCDIESVATQITKQDSGPCQTEPACNNGGIILKLIPMEDTAAWKVLLRLISSIPKGSYFSLICKHSKYPEVGLPALVRETHMKLTKYINPSTLLMWLTYAGKEGAVIVPGSVCRVSLIEMCIVLSIIPFCFQSE